MSASWVSVTDKGVATSGLNQSNATGSFNYTGPVVSLPSVTGSDAFWRSRGGDPVGQVADSVGLPPYVIVGALVAAVWFFWRRR